MRITETLLISALSAAASALISYSALSTKVDALVEKDESERPYLRQFIEMQYEIEYLREEVNALKVELKKP